MNPSLPLCPKFFQFYICKLFLPLGGSGSPQGGNPRKMAKNYKIPLPGPTPKIREIATKGRKLLRNYDFCQCSEIFPNFGVRTREGNSAIFPQFWGISAPKAGRGKTTRNSTSQKVITLKGPPTLQNLWWENHV